MTRKKGIGIVAAALALSFALHASAHAWHVDVPQSTLAFTNTYQDVEYTGQFHRFTAAIDYDPDDLAHAKFDVTVDIASMDSQNSERDHAALGADFFDSARFPRARFVTTSFRKAVDGRVLADGVLDLRGVRKPVTLIVKFATAGGTATLDVKAQLDRLDFGIGVGQWADPSMIGNRVVVHGHLVLQANPR